jgi:hypothetical protein
VAPESNLPGLEITWYLLVFYNNYVTYLSVKLCSERTWLFTVHIFLVFFPSFGFRFRFCCFLHFCIRKMILGRWKESYTAIYDSYSTIYRDCHQWQELVPPGKRANEIFDEYALQHLNRDKSSNIELFQDVKRY